jgi:hypothetical protein
MVNKGVQAMTGETPTESDESFNQFIFEFECKRMKKENKENFKIMGEYINKKLKESFKVNPHANVMSIINYAFYKEAFMNVNKYKPWIFSDEKIIKHFHEQWFKIRERCSRNGKKGVEQRRSNKLAKIAKKLNLSYNKQLISKLEVFMKEIIGFYSEHGRLTSFASEKGIVMRVTEWEEHNNYDLFIPWSRAIDQANRFDSLNDWLRNEAALIIGELDE